LDVIFNGARVLAISPHPDDAEFGLGASLHRHRAEIDVMVLVLSDRSQTRGETENERDQRHSLERLGLPATAAVFIDEFGSGFERLPIRNFGAPENRDTIRQVASLAVRQFDPDLVFTPALRETMQDHQAVAEEVVRVVRGRAWILGYEVPKHNRGFKPDCFVQVAEEDVMAKHGALTCYTEFTNRYYFELDVIRSLARVRAVDAGFFGFCEAFELYRAAQFDAGAAPEGLTSLSVT
jgi:N-acetylglucosamine malate deacetylase 1